MAIEDNLDPTQEEEEDNVFMDVVKAPFRGVEAAAQGVYNLADFATGDILPDYDTRFLGESKTTAGSVVEGISQFLTGFIPVAGWLGKAGKVSKARKMFGDDVARKVAMGGSLTAKETAAINATTKTAEAFRGMKAGIAADFLVFNGQEERLSNFLYEYPAFQQPIIDYLQADPDDTELEGRFKNVLEGLFVDIGASTLLMPFVKSIKMLKKRRHALAEGKPAGQVNDEVLEQAEIDEQLLLNLDTPELKTLKADEVELRADEAELKVDQEAPTEQALDPQLELELKPKEADVALDTESRFQKEVELSNNIAEELKVGGEQALRSNIRLVSSDADIATLAKAVAMNQEVAAKEAGTFAKTSKEELLKETVDAARDMAEIMGTDINDYEKQVRRLAGKAKELEALRKEQGAIGLLNESIGIEVYRLAEEARKLPSGSPEFDAKMVEVRHAINVLEGSQKVWANFGRSGGLLQLQRRHIYEDVKTSRFDKIPDEITVQDIHKSKDNRIGTLSDDKLIDLILLSDTSEGMSASLNKIAKSSFGGNMMDMTQEYWMNSILSGLTTQFVNIAGSALTYALSTTERAVGSALTGNFHVTKATLKYAFSMNAVAEAFSLAWRAMKAGDAISIPEAKLFNDRNATRKAISYNPGGDPTAFSRTFNMLGELIRMPSRGLVAGDELFKALNYRTYVASELGAEAFQKGLRGKDAAKYVADRMSGYITKGGRIFNESGIMKEIVEQADKKGLKFAERKRFIHSEFNKAKTKPITLPDGTQLSFKDRGALVAKAVEFAKVNTHTQDPTGIVGDVSRSISKYAEKIPLLKFVVPFIKTPTNILTYSVKRSPIGSVDILRNKYRKVLQEGTEQEKIELVGRLSTAISSLAAISYFLHTRSGTDFITGNGPADPDQRKSWELTHQPYSIKVGDKWVSYQRLDPVATILGIIADINDVQLYENIEEDSLEKLFQATVLAATVNITNKSYIQSMDNLFTLIRNEGGDIGKNVNRFFGNIVGGFVPNIVNQSLNAQEDRVLREARTIRDRIIKKTPLEGMLPPRRNILGEPEISPTSGGFAGIINPLYIKEDPKDMVKTEIANLKAKFSDVPHFLRPGVDELNMREYYNPETGQQAYDRMLELTGKVELRGLTLKQRLEKMFKSKEYQRLSEIDLKEETGKDSPRIKAVKKLISAYRSIAKSQMLRENPELHQRLINADNLYRQNAIKSQ